MNIGGIPQALRAYPYWCVWKLQNRDGGKPTKVPFNPCEKGRASSSDKGTFASFADAERAYNRGGYSGLGIGLFDDMAAIDIDHCIDCLCQ